MPIFISGKSGVLSPPVNLALTAEDVFSVSKTGGVDHVLRVDTRDPAVAGSMDAVEIYLNGSNGTTGEIAGSSAQIRNLYLFSSVNTGTQSALHRGIHAQVRATGSAVYSSTSGGSLRGGHFAAVWNSTGTALAISGIQTNATVATAGITAGLVSEIHGNRILVEFTGTGAGSITNASALFIQSFGSPSATRTVSSYNGIQIQNCKATGITTARAIKTGNGPVELGDRILTARALDIASSGTITVGEGNFAFVTGAATINYITSTDFKDGCFIFLRLSPGITMNHNTAGAPGGTAAMQLSGSINWTVPASGGTITFVFFANNWTEVARTVY